MKEFQAIIDFHVNNLKFPLFVGLGRYDKNKNLTAPTIHLWWRRGDASRLKGLGVLN